MAEEASLHEIFLGVFGFVPGVGMLLFQLALGQVEIGTEDGCFGAPVRYGIVPGGVDVAVAAAVFDIIPGVGISARVSTDCDGRDAGLLGQQIEGCCVARVFDSCSLFLIEQKSLQAA